MQINVLEYLEKSAKNLPSKTAYSDSTNGDILRRAGNSRKEHRQSYFRYHERRNQSASCCDH